MKLSNNVGTKSWDIQTGPLGIISLKGSEEFGQLVNKTIINRRQELIEQNDEHMHLSGYLRDSFLISSDCPRFSTGEAKAVLNETIRGYDIYIIADIGNYNCTYKMYDTDQRMSPDDHYQDVKRIIAALGGKARRISVIMPLLYESRQHKRSSREQHHHVRRPRSARAECDSPDQFRKPQRILPIHQKASANGKSPDDR
jgi:ribose-phosphate pyrophosphokinase